VIVIVTNDGVVLASDSKVNNPLAGEPNSINKLYVMNDQTTIGVIGGPEVVLTAPNTDGFRWRASKMLMEVKRRFAANASLSTLAGIIEMVMEHAFDHVPPNLSNWLIEHNDTVPADRDHVTFVFGGFESGKPIVEVMTFKFETYFRNPPKSSVSALDTSSGVDGIYPFGHTDAIGRSQTYGTPEWNFASFTYPAAYRKRFANLDEASETAADLIRIQSHFDSQFVAPPIHVVIVRPIGEHAEETFP
jgi:hypothetical protein